MIDTDTPESPGWWLVRASNELTARAKRLKVLQSYLEGCEPLPHGAEGLEEAYRAFQRKSRTNWSLRIVEVAAERIRLNGIQTSVDADSDGDAVATQQAETARLFRELPKTVDDMLGLHVGYLMVGRGERNDVVVTSESPWNTITFHDPRTDDTVVGVKIYSDPDRGVAFAHLAMVEAEGGIRAWVARRNIGRGAKLTPRFSGAAWQWDEDQGGAEGTQLEVSTVPVVRCLNHRGVGDFERHLDLLDRITHQTLQRLVMIATQAYQQRVMIGAPAEDENGDPIDYDGLRVGPGSLWDLPDGIQMWEGKQASLDGVLSASKDDRRELAAVTGTPLPVLLPDSTNQSAEGASFAKEGLIFRCEKRIEILNPEVARTYSLIAELSGDRSRADMRSIRPMWADPARRSLAEMADAATKAQQDLPLEERLVKIWGYDPDQAAKIAQAKRDEQLQLMAYQGVAGG